jgi:hypothetical protein
MVAMGAIAGDPVALESFRAAVLDPRVFIIGGGV